MVYNKRITFKKGDEIRYTAWNSTHDGGLSYPAGKGIVAESGFAGGWDVYELEGGESIYGFSIRENFGRQKQLI